jgi:hypothetical protein
MPARDKPLLITHKVPEVIVDFKIGPPLLPCEADDLTIIDAEGDFQR